MNYPLPGVIVDPNGQTTAVSITTPAGGAITVYGDSNGLTTKTMPATISGKTIFYLPDAGTWSVAGQSVTLEDSEIATVVIPPAAPTATVAGQFNVKTYGAKGDGSTDDTTAIQSAVTAAAAGGTVYFPPGTYAVSGTLDLASGVAFQGPATLKPTSDYGPALLIPAGCQGFAVRQLTINYTGITSSSVSTPSTHAGIKFTIATSASQISQQGVIEDVQIVGMGQAIYMPWLQGSSLNYAQYNQIDLNRVAITSCNIGLLLNGMSDCSARNVVCQNMFGQDAASLEPKIAPISTSATPSNTYSATCQNLINDLGNSRIVKLEVYGGTGDGIVFEDCITTDADVEAGSLTGNGVTVAGCNTGFTLRAHTGLCTTNGINVTTSANSTADINLIGCRSDTNHQHGILMAPGGSGAIGPVRMIGCDCVNNSQQTSTSYDGVNFTGSDLEVIGGRYSDTQTSHTQRYGINVNNTGTDQVCAVGAQVLNNVTAPWSVSGSHVMAIGCDGISGAVSAYGSDVEFWLGGSEVGYFNSGGLVANGSLNVGYYANLGSPQTTLNGTTAGSIIWCMPFQGGSYKKFVGVAVGYENTTATAQTVTFPTAFTHTPIISQSGISGATASTTTLTLPASMGSAQSGVITVEGF